MEHLKKYSVCILAFLFFRYWVVSPWIDEQETLKTEYVTVIKVQKKSEALLSEREEIARAAAKIKTIVTENSAYIFSKESTPRDALSQMQKQVRELMETSELEIKSITWGEPQSDTSPALTRLPLAFVASGEPAAFHAFLRSVTMNKPLLLLDTLTVTPGRNLLKINGQLVSFLRTSTSAAKQ